MIRQKGSLHLLGRKGKRWYDGLGKDLFSRSL